MRGGAKGRSYLYQKLGFTTTNYFISLILETILLIRFNRRIASLLPSLGFIRQQDLVFEASHKRFLDHGCHYCCSQLRGRRSVTLSFRRTPRQPQTYWCSLLVLTLRRQHLACFELLLDSGADCNVLSEKEGNCVHIASLTEKRLPFLELLTSRGAGLEGRNDMFATPLLMACAGGNFPGVQHLLERGASVIARSGSHNTPLHLACRRGSANIVELLLNHGGGVDPESLNSSGESPLYLACRRNYEHCARVLLEKGALVEPLGILDTPLAVAMETKSFECFQLLIQKGADVNRRDISGRTPLHWACMLPGGSQFVQALISAGADVNATDDDGGTPVYVVSRYDALDSLELLIEAGADVKIDNNEGDMPLHRAVTSNITDASTQIDIVNCLIDAGCNQLIRNAIGLRPYDVAVKPEVKNHLVRLAKPPGYG